MAKHEMAIIANMLGWWNKSYISYITKLDFKYNIYTRVWETRRARISVFSPGKWAEEFKMVGTYVSHEAPNSTHLKYNYLSYLLSIDGADSWTPTLVNKDRLSCIISTVNADVLATQLD